MPAQQAPANWAAGARTALYGSTDGKDINNSAFARRRLDVYPMFQSLMLPWLLFCLIFAVMSFLRSSNSGLCWATVATCGVIVLAFVGTAILVLYKKLKSLEARDPMWLVFLAISLTAAMAMGVLLGLLNYSTYMQPYSQYESLGHYFAVDPQVRTGLELMDAGRVQFVKSATLDLRRSMGFKNLDTYCVTPITTRSPDGTLPALASYDFWAVGLNCCSGRVADFHCGEYANPKAHGGLRLIDDSQSAFFQLAVQQAEASYSIKAKHPLFLYWAEDATAELNSFRDEGIKYYLIGTMCHFAWQVLCVALAARGFGKLRL